MASAFRRKAQCICVLCAIVLPNWAAEAGIRRIWAANDGEKIERDPRILALAENIHSNPGPGRRLPIFYWYSVHWRHNSQKQGERNQNVWANTITFDNRAPGAAPDDAGYIHGDGVLMYPGEEKLHPEEDRGVPGPIGTIQLATFRRGLQDHQYLTLARSLGLEAEVVEALRTIVPRVFSDAGEKVSFPETGDPYERVRLALARAMARKPSAQGGTARAQYER